MTQQNFYHLTKVSGNSKTGPIPVSTSSRSTCPKVCPLRRDSEGGCYADGGKVAIHWNKVSSGERGADFQTFLKEVARLPKGIVWRYSQAGDLPGDGDANRLDRGQCLALAKVGTSRNKRPIAFTHFPLLPGSDPNAEHNAQVIRDMSMTVNLSANNPAEADALADTGIGPVVTVLPESDLGKRHGKTPAGRTLLVCPATWPELDNMTCARCKLCAKSNADRNKIVIGFPAHSAGKKKATAVCLSTSNLHEGANHA